MSIIFNNNLSIQPRVGLRLNQFLALKILLAGVLCLFAGVASAAVLRVGNGAEPETLDPHKAETVSSANILRDLYEGLTMTSPKGELVPGVAERWEVSPDGLLYIFHLRPNARWSNGDAVTAEDFVAGLRRTVDPATGSSYAQGLSPILNADAVMAAQKPVTALGVTALDALTLQIQLKAPTPYLLGLLAHASSYPIHRPSFAQHGAQFARAGKLIGNGAYQLSAWVPQDSVTLVKNPHYWNAAQAQIEKVIYVPTEDSGAELKRYRANELDVTSTVPLTQAKWIQKNLAAELRVASYIGVSYYGFNVVKPPFQNQTGLRRALSMAVDREVLAKKVLNGISIPAWGWVPPGVWNYGAQQFSWARWPRMQRIAEAKRLYAAAGYSEQNPLEIEIRYNTSEDNKRIATVIAAMWKQTLGVKSRLVNEEFKVFLANRKLKKDTQVFRSGWIGDYNDATTFSDILHSTHGQNDQGYNNPDYDRLLEQAAAEPDLQARRALLEEAERILLEDSPVIPLTFAVSKHLVKPWVQGWEDNVLDYHATKDLRILPH